MEHCRILAVHFLLYASGRLPKFRCMIEANKSWDIRVLKETREKGNRRKKEKKKERKTKLAIRLDRSKGDVKWSVSAEPRGGRARKYCTPSPRQKN